MVKDVVVAAVMQDGMILKNGVEARDAPIQPVRK
jgi:hypothetical protein